MASLKKEAFLFYVGFELTQLGLLVVRGTAFIWP